jgi:peptide/nickel transport system permease protein
MIHGARISLTVSIVAIFFGNVVGTAIGLFSGYRGGWIDAILMRIVDIFISLPNLLLAILLVALFGASFQNVILVIALNLWTRSARQIRAVTLATKEEEFVALAKVAGASQWRIMALHIFPNTIPVLLVLVTLEIGGVILFESSLSFLGVGLPPPQPSWGVMVADGRGLLQSAWWISLIPGVAIAITVTGFNLFGDWLRDRLDPTLSQTR